MRNVYSKKIYLIIILSILIIMTIEFATLSNVLIISPAATVSPDKETFKVIFSNVDIESEVELSNEVIANVYPSDVRAENAIIDNDMANGPTLKNLSAIFTEPGQQVAYNFYIYNNGEYDAFLKAAVFNDVENEHSEVVCRADEGSSQELIDQVCLSMKITIDIDFDETGKTLSLNSTDTEISNYKLEASKFANISVKILYDTDSSVIPDGDFEVRFGSIFLRFASSDQV